MAQELKVSTAVTIQLGPFLDKTDGVTQEVGLSPSVQVSKNGGAFAARSSASAITHDAQGWYRVPLDGTDTGTLGRLIVQVQSPATHLPLWREFNVVAANYFDTKYGSAAFSVNATEVAGAVWDEARSGHVAQGTFGEALAGAVTQAGKVSDSAADVHEFDTDLISMTEGHYDGQLLVMTSGGAKGQVVPILHYKGSTGKLRLAWPLRSAPANNDTFVIVPWGRMALPGLLLETTIGLVNSQTQFVLRDAPGSDGDYNGLVAGFIDADTGQVSYRRITGFVASSKTMTVASAPDFVVANDDIVQILGSAAPAATDVADAVLDELTSEHQTAGSLGAELHLAKAMLANKRMHTISTGVDQVMDDDGTTVLRTMTPTDNGNDTITVDPS